MDRRHGCMHGELDLLYAAVRAAEASAGVKVSLLISCGDFRPHGTVLT